MAEIKSALEKAMERAEKIGRATEEEMKGNTYLEGGKRLAARYLQEEDMELMKILQQEPSEAQPYFLKGLEETFLRNIVLPRDEDLEKTTQKALQAILILKRNASPARKLAAQIEELFRQYKRTTAEARAQLKARFAAKLGGLQKQIQQQLHAKVSIDVEQQPQFQEEWLQITAEMNAQFNRFLEQQKDLLKAA